MTEKLLSFVRKAALVLTGVLVSLAVMEAGLRAAGAVYQLQRAAPAQASSPAVPSEPVDILCIGDSFTFGYGAPVGQSYPDALQRLLSGDFGAAAPRVGNAGQLGYNSSQMSNHLEELLREYRPRVLVVLTGLNDPFFLAESNYYLFMRGPRALVWRADALLSRSRVYELIRLGASGLMARLSAHAQHLSAGPRPEARNTSPAYEALLRRGDALARDTRPAEAVAAYEEAAGLFPDEFRAHMRAGQTCLHALQDFPRAEKHLRAALRIDPEHPLLLKELWQLYYRLGNTAAAEKTLSRYLALDPRENSKYDAALRYGIPSVGDKTLFHALTRYNLAAIARTAGRHGVRVLVMNYPGYEALHPNATITRAAEQYRLPYVDQYAAFTPFRDRGVPRTDLFVPGDCHPNERGYRVMADQVYRALRTQGLAETPRTAGRGEGPSRARKIVW